MTKRGTPNLSARVRASLAYPESAKNAQSAFSLSPRSQRHSTSFSGTQRTLDSTWATTAVPRRSSPLRAGSSLGRTSAKPNHFRYCAAAATASAAVRMVTGRNGGLLAGGTELAQATCWGVWLHGSAGDRLAARVGPTGYLARELLDGLPAVLVELSAS